MIEEVPLVPALTVRTPAVFTVPLPEMVLLPPTVRLTAELAVKLLLKVMPPVEAIIFAVLAAPSVMEFCRTTLPPVRLTVVLPPFTIPTLAVPTLLIVRVFVPSVVVLPVPVYAPPVWKFRL